MPVFCHADDKRIPLYRIVWISDLPHFCGDDQCQREGQYEIRLEQSEAVWASPAEHEAAVAAWQAWLLGKHQEDEAN